MPEARPPSVAPRTSPTASTPTAPGAPAASTAAKIAPEGERPDPLAADVARAVRELRLAAGLSERAAARLLGTSQTQLRRMEDPRYLPSLRSLARLATAYGHRLRIDLEPKDRPPTRVKRDRGIEEEKAPKRTTTRKPARRTRGDARPARRPTRKR